MIKKIIYLLLGILLVAFSMQIMFLLVFSQGEIAEGDILNSANPIGVVMIIAIVVIAGFYLLKIGFASTKSFFGKD